MLKARIPEEPPSLKKPLVERGGRVPLEISGTGAFLSWRRLVPILIGLGLAALLLAGGEIWDYFYHSSHTTVNETAAPAAETVPVEAKKPATEAIVQAPSPPEFDIVRVEPDGEMTVAGRAAPGAQVVLLADTRVLARTKADDAGEFVFLPDALTSGDYSLSLSMTPKDGDPLASVQSVIVSVPEKVNGKPQGEVMVALAEPGKPTVLLSDPTLAPKAASYPMAGGASKPLVIAFKTAEIDPRLGFFTSGEAPPGAKLRLYFNNSFIAKLVADTEGKWSLRIAKGMSPGHYDLRLDEIDSSNKVIERAEIPFDFPATGAGFKKGDTSLAELNAGAVQGQTGTSIDNLKTAKVQRGDTLWRISKKLLGSGFRYTEIYTANQSQIRDPQRIYPGQVLVLPREHE